MCERVYLPYIHAYSWMRSDRTCNYVNGHTHTHTKSRHKYVCIGSVDMPYVKHICKIHSDSISNSISYDLEQCFEALEAKAKQKTKHISPSAFDLSFQRSHSFRKPAVCLRLYRMIFIVFACVLECGSPFIFLLASHRSNVLEACRVTKSFRHRDAKPQPNTLTHANTFDFRFGTATKSSFSIKTSVSNLFVMICFPRADRGGCRCCCCCFFVGFANSWDLFWLLWFHFIPNSERRAK